MLLKFYVPNKAIRVTLSIFYWPDHIILQLCTMQLLIVFGHNYVIVVYACVENFMVSYCVCNMWSHKGCLCIA